MATLLRKIAQATAIFIVGTSLEPIGYVPNSIQTLSTILKIKINGIERRRRKSNKLPLEETIFVCKKVTGQSFKNLSNIN